MARRNTNIESQIIERLKILNPVKIILFGSYAYGNPSRDSDSDICVIKNNVRSKIEEKRTIRQLLKDIFLAKDILVPTSEEYEFYKNETGSVYNEIDKKGIILWPNS